MTTDYTNVKLGDVTGWAPTPDTFEFNFNYCDGGKQFVPPANGTIKPSGVDGNLAAIRGLRDGDYDALYIYADQIYNFIKSGDPLYDDIANGFGTDFAYIHTGLDQWSINGTTLAISKRGSGLKQVLDPCIAAVQRPPPTPHTPHASPSPLTMLYPSSLSPRELQLMGTKCLPLSASACPSRASPHLRNLTPLSLPARARQHTRRPPSPPASARQDADLPGYLHQALQCILVHQQPSRGSRADLLRCQDERTHRRENLRRRLLHVLGLERVGRPRR